MIKRKIFLQSGSSRQAALPIISDSTMKIDLGLDLHSHLLCNSILYIFVANCYAIGRRLQKAILDICCQDNSYSFSTSNFRAFCHNHSFFCKAQSWNGKCTHFASCILLSFTAQRIWPNYSPWSDTVGRGAGKFRTFRQFIYLCADISCDNIAMDLFLFFFSGGLNSPWS